jgi:hypothetical protein
LPELTRLTEPITWSTPKSSTAEAMQTLLSSIAPAPAVARWPAPTTVLVGAEASLGMETAPGVAAGTGSARAASGTASASGPGSGALLGVETAAPLRTRGLAPASYFEITNPWSPKAKQLQQLWLLSPLWRGHLKLANSSSTWARLSGPELTHAAALLGVAPLARLARLQQLFWVRGAMVVLSIELEGLSQGGGVAQSRTIGDRETTGEGVF